jgi:hypothetical protein
MHELDFKYILGVGPENLLVMLLGDERLNQPEDIGEDIGVTAEDRTSLRRALEIVSRSVKSDDIHALRSLARVQAETGDRDASKESFRRAIAVIDFLT